MAGLPSTGLEPLRSVDVPRYDLTPKQRITVVERAYSEPESASRGKRLHITSYCITGEYVQRMSCSAHVHGDVYNVGLREMAK